MSSKLAFQPLSDLATEVLNRVRVVLADIDDTLTTDGRLTAEAYTAMERLERAGIALAPVTGRPAGWCDHIARMWPVAGVIGENGAFYFHYDRSARLMRRVYAQAAETRATNRNRLETLAKDILTAVPAAIISADQFTREVDLAIDFSEDVPALPDDEIERIVDLFHTAGATAKVSSIHVNGWFGEHDKLTMAKRFLREVLSIDSAAENGSITYIGDSPNDELMWRYFNVSIGVANATRFKERLDSPPAYVTARKGGEGFAEFTQTLIAALKKPHDS